MRKLKHKEVRGPTSRKWQGQDSNPGLSDSRTGDSTYHIILHHEVSQFSLSGENKLVPHKEIFREEGGFGMNLIQGIYFWIA